MKIDIYVREPGEKEFVYRRSTTLARTCREAKANFIECYPAYAPENVRTRRVPEGGNRAAASCRREERLVGRLERLSQAYQDAAGRVEAAELFLRGLRLDRKKAAGEYDAAAALLYPAAPRTSAG